ncbi:MAG: hypothetical protein Q9187_009407, partial [Circinaria calcarea]
ALEQDEGEKAPLTDARKGRARGPARRKPAASPSAAEEAKTAVSKLELVEPWTVWQISSENNGSLEVPHATKASVAEAIQVPTSTSEPHTVDEPSDAPSTLNVPDVTLAEVLEAEGPPSKEDGSKPVEDIAENDISIHISPADRKDSNLGRVPAGSSKTTEIPADLTETEVSTGEISSTEDAAADDPAKPGASEMFVNEERSTVLLANESGATETKVENV